MQHVRRMEHVENVEWLEVVKTMSPLFSRDNVTDTSGPTILLLFY